MAARDEVTDGIDPDARERHELSRFAGRVAIATLVVVGILVAAVLVWEARLVVALLFTAIILAAALRPGVERLGRLGMPHGIGVVLHYAALLALVAVGLWFVVPAATDQVEAALGPQHQLRQAARESTGIKHDILVALDRKLSDVPSGSSLVDPAVEYGRKAFEVLIGTFFVLAASAYWIVERDRAVDLVCSLLPRDARRFATRGTSSSSGSAPSSAARRCWWRSWRRCSPRASGRSGCPTGSSSVSSRAWSRSCP